MRVAFTLFGGDGWTGGINYLRNLLSAVAELPGRPVEALLFHAPDADQASIAMLAPYLARPPIVVEGWGTGFRQRALRLAGSVVLQRDRVSEAAFRGAGVDVVFQHAAWYGLRFPLPTLAWIADFQHRHLPQMFSRANVLKRDAGYTALSLCATRIMVSSEDARADCARFFPLTRDRISVVPFCVRIPDTTLARDPVSVREHYGLPERYFYLPNQLWKHKNHLGLLEGLRLLRDQGVKVRVVASGNPKDGRNPAHPDQVLEFVRRHALEECFTFLGLIPYEDVMPLMRASTAVVNPSLFEGWSTTVEEAKALGVPLLLSNLGVHREQAARTALFFDPYAPAEIAAVMHEAWATLPNGPDSGREAVALAEYRHRRVAFAKQFTDVLQVTIQNRNP